MVPAACNIQNVIVIKPKNLEKKSLYGNIPLPIEPFIMYKVKMAEFTQSFYFDVFD